MGVPVAIARRRCRPELPIEQGSSESCTQDGWFLPNLTRTAVHQQLGHIFWHFSIMIDGTNAAAIRENSPKPGGPNN
jgi:hypothetical protein